MDINQLYTVDAHEKGAEMQLKDENGKLLDMYITIVGIDSRVFRAALSKLRRGIISDPDADTEPMRAHSNAEVSLGWRGFLNKGKELKFSADRVEKLYINAPYLMDQVDAFISKRSNFMRG